MTVFNGKAGAARLVSESERLAVIRARAMPVEGCGPAIPLAPARGPQVAVVPHVIMPDPKEAGGYKVEQTGWRGFSAAKAADIFDMIAMRAVKRGAKSPFTKGQVNVARRYRDLVERHEAGGMRCASLEARRSSGPSGGGEFMDAFVSEGEAIAWLRARIGNGVAMTVRRVRPSARGGKGARIITDRVLVDSICLEGRSFRDVLDRHGWAQDGKNAARLIVAMATVLDRMQGYGGSGVNKPS